jgi:hypothetical protein
MDGMTNISRPAWSVRRLFARSATMAAVVVLLASCEQSLLSVVQNDVKASTAPKNPTIEVYRGGTQITNGATYDFGSQPNGSDFDVVFTLKNTGSGDLTLSANPAVSPSNITAGFSVYTLPASIIAAGSSSNVVIRFHPNTAITYNATATIVSNATNLPSFSFTVTGVGVAPDTIPPTGSIAISGGAQYTQGTTINLVLSATDTGGGTVQQMLIGNDAGFTGNSWEPYATTRVWTLTTGDALKTIYVRYKDTSSNPSGIYSVTITLDTVNPSFTTVTPANNTTNVSRTSTVVFNFSENMDQTTFTTASVKLTEVETSSSITCTLSKTATTATLTPSAPLKFGYAYRASVTAAIKDLSGRILSNPGNVSTFRVLDDYFENPNDNNASARAFDVSSGGMGPADIRTVQFQSGALNSVAILGDTADFYKITISPSDAFTLHVRAYFSDAAGTLQAAGTDEIILYLTHAGAGLGGIQTIVTSAANDKSYDYDLSTGGLSGDFIILVYNNSGTANLRTYNLWWWAEPGI